MRAPTPVHQYHPDAQPGSPVATRMLALQGWLRQAGHASDIAVAQPGPALPGAKALATLADGTWLIHVASGQEDLTTALALTGRKILVVHGLQAARVGRIMLMRALGSVDYVLATTNSARRALRDAGCARAGVLPFWPDMGHWAGLKPDKATLQAVAPCPHILAVGPLTAAGGLEDAIRAAAHYRQAHDGSARLIVLADAPGAPGYVQGLKELAHAEGVAFMVADRPAAAVRKAYMQTALAVISLGAQPTADGPLLEALGSGVPVIALRALEAEEAMAGAGILLDTPEPDAIGALIHTVHADADLRGKLLERQRRRVAELRRVDPRQALAEAIARAHGTATDITWDPLESTCRHASLSIL